MTLGFSDRSKILEQSEIRNMSIECDRVNGINLSQGICDLALRPEVESGAIDAIKDGINHYTRYDGLPDLRQAIAEKVKKYNNIECDQEKNVVVSSGATGALFCAFFALLNPGDEIIIFEPFYGYHLSTILAAQLVPKFVELKTPNWDINLDDLASVVTDKTKAIIVNTPSNPCGKVFSENELKLIADFSIKHDLFIFTDEIYEYLVYDNKKHISPASLPEIFDRTITISGYSKTFSITGWRIGYIVCHEKWKTMIGYMNDLLYVCAPAPLQIGVANGIQQIPDNFYVELSRSYQIKRDILCETLDQIGLTTYKPDGAYYILADTTKVPGSTSKEKAMYILKKTGVAGVPGDAFYIGEKGTNLIRFCFAKEEKIIKLACDKLKNLFN